MLSNTDERRRVFAREMIALSRRAKSGQVTEKDFVRYCLIKLWALRHMMRMCGALPPDHPMRGDAPGFERTLADENAHFVQRMYAAEALMWVCPEKRGEYRAKKDRESRGSHAVALWRQKVLERDGYACTTCNGKKDLHAHHIVAWARSAAGRTNVANGITLCGDCHRELHAARKA